MTKTGQANISITRSVLLRFQLSSGLIRPRKPNLLSLENQPESKLILFSSRSCNIFSLFGKEFGNLKIGTENKIPKTPTTTKLSHFDWGYHTNSDQRTVRNGHNSSTFTLSMLQSNLIRQYQRQLVVMAFPKRSCKQNQ